MQATGPASALTEPEPPSDKAQESLAEQDGRLKTKNKPVKEAPPRAVPGLGGRKGKQLSSGRTTATKVGPPPSTLCRAIMPCACVCVHRRVPRRVPVCPYCCVCRSLCCQWTWPILMKLCQRLGVPTCPRKEALSRHGRCQCTNTQSPGEPQTVT